MRTTRNGLNTFDIKIFDCKGKLKLLIQNYLNEVNNDEKELLLGLIMSNKYNLRILRKERRIIEKIVKHNREIELSVGVTSI
ncbi:hypothetical protein LCGC14_0225490 [marine sediment metagenome]|uniref:Uncharacterized protein n=1 Tax=marine sediment metagenome TaxID=412755 RepID=A0A0F9UCR1_9ZZZZ